MPNLNIFDGITVDNKGRISPQDREFCDNQQALFVRTFQQILDSQHRLEKELADNPNPAFEIRYHAPQVSDKYQYFRYQETEVTDDMKYRTFEYSPLYALKACEKLYKDLCQRFEQEIISYFNETYGCEFKEENRIYRALFPKYVKVDRYGDITLDVPGDMFLLPEKDTPIPSYEILVDYIIGELGGKSFAEKRSELDLKNFIDKFGWHSIEAKKNIVKISGCIYYSYFNDDYEIRYEEKSKIGILCRAVRTVFNLPDTPVFRYDNIYAGTDVWFGYGGNVLDSFKAFKNGNLQVVFRTAEQAQTFADTVNRLKPKDRWR